MTHGKPRTALFVFAVLCFYNASYAAHERVAVRIPVRDTAQTGKSLAADVYLPVGDGPWPAVLIQTPYGKSGYIASLQFGLTESPLFLSNEYAFVVVDWRGFFGSGDAAYAGSPTRGQDGYDTVEWIAAQPWCDGAVGTWGASALGKVQMQTAAEKPPHLKACAPIVYNTITHYELYYPGGLYLKNRNDFVSGYFSAFGWLRDHPTLDAFWKAAEALSVISDRIEAPMLHVTGWFDHQTLSTVNEFQTVAEIGGVDYRDHQYLLIGPWSHAGVGDPEQGEAVFEDAARESGQVALEFFDRYLRGDSSAFANRPRIQYYAIHEGWRTAHQWPLPANREMALYFGGDSEMVFDDPPPENEAVSYWSVPSDPSPVLWGPVLRSEYGAQGPGDVRPLLDWDDVIAFVSEPFERDVLIQGRPEARCWIESETVDADLIVRLVDIGPDGRWMSMVDGARRLSLRDGFEEKKPLEPGELYEVTVDLNPIAMRVPAGRRIGLIIASTCYDLYAVNPQNGMDFMEDSGAPPAAGAVTVHTGPDYPSRLILPALEENNSVGDWPSR